MAKILKHLFLYTLFMYFATQNTVQAQLKYGSEATLWADSVLRTMSTDEKIGQLFTVAAYSNKTEAHKQEIISLINQYHIGGLIFMQGGPVRQAILCNYYQSLSRIPLLISIDGEWGLSMRLDSTIRFPRQMAMGAITNDSLIYNFGLEVARQCKIMGIHVNYAPVIDVNDNPMNPVINDRAFGEDMYEVAAKGIAYMQGMQAGGILTCAKHFPGHGHTDKDSHLSLPTVLRSKKEIDSVELYPFKQLIANGVTGIMVAHLNIPALDTTTNRATTLSPKVVTELLQNELGYKGLIYTDALNMKGVSAYYAPGGADVEALLAGNDILLFSESVPGAIEGIKQAIADGKITLTEIERRIKKQLEAKFAVGLNAYKPIDIFNLNGQLNTPEAMALNADLAAASLTLIGNPNDLVPFTNIRNEKVAAVSIGAAEDNVFLNTIQNYSRAKIFSIKKNASYTDFQMLLTELKKFDKIIVGIHDMSRSAASNYSITVDLKQFLYELYQNKNVVTAVFGNPYSLKNFDNLKPIIMAYEDNANSRSMAAQLIFGGIKANGTLPVTASENMKRGDGYITTKPVKMQYTPFVAPDNMAIDEINAAEIDAIAHKAIDSGATPGCQILVAKNGKVLYYKSFGTHTYADKTPVKNNDVYDLASLTKILATTPVIMKLYDMGEIDLDKKLSAYLEEFKGTNKKNITIRELLTHTSGLKAFLPIWPKANGLNQLGDSILSRKYSFIYSQAVANNIYSRFDYKNDFIQNIIASDITKRGSYTYSDLNLILLAFIAERLTGKNIELLANEYFYKPLELPNLGFRPLNANQPLAKIIPTEYDSLYRKQLIHGYVHDPSAAILGGVAGNAGLFSNANDVAIMMQMLLNNGTYAGKEYLKESTVKLFTSAPLLDKGIRRGLGFDKPETTKTKDSPASASASASTFGHTGFTGTSTWADPETGLIFVFLSNRINTTANNKKLIKMNIRTNAQQAMYDIMKNNF